MPSKFFTVIAGLIAIFAGIYLANMRAVGSNSMIETLGNGIGWYCIARGLFMISSMANITGSLERGASQNNSSEDDTQECRSCMGYVHKFAVKCKHCGSDLARH